MNRFVKYFPDGPGLDDKTLMHDRHMVAYFRCNEKIMGNQNYSGVMFMFEADN